MPNGIKQRLHEIDLLRGAAVILMIIFHFLFDLNFFRLANFNLENLPWSLIAKIAQIIFIVCAGITFTFSAQRSGLSTTKFFQNKLKYLFTLSILAASITLVTWLLFGEQYVKFGILHFYVLATILTIPLRRLNIWNGLLGFLIILATFFLPKFDAPWWTYPTGLSNQTIIAFDYFPLFPWYGVFLLGAAFGSFLINRNIFQNYQPILKNQFIEKIGRHSLLIYLINQPILAGLIWIYATLIIY
ncbi:MAG: DUF1624 domain-containing protein [Candidatus Altimarinota bacterium]